MSTPLKPWEQRVLNSSAPLQLNTIFNTRNRVGPPPLPPRPNMSTSYGNMGNSYGYMNGARPYGYNSYGGGYGGYGGGYSGMGYGGMFGNYGGGLYGNNYGYGMGPESRFIQMAEESTRPAFQGIESLVRAFGSIAMMLDSTYFAVTNSFRAVLGVAENFGHIRNMFAQIWSNFALLRFINWIYNKLMSLLGYKISEETIGTRAWEQAMNEAGTQLSQGGTSVSNWPIFMFLGMIVSAPYFISKLLPPLIDKRNPENWSTPGKRVKVVHSFNARNDDELSVQQGEDILIAPKSVQEELRLMGTGWVLASSMITNRYGLIPINHVQAVQAAPVAKYSKDDKIFPELIQTGNVTVDNSQLVGNVNPRDSASNEEIFNKAEASVDEPVPGTSQNKSKLNLEEKDK